MEARLPYVKLNPAGYRALSALQQVVEASGLDHSLIELVKIRSSQINGCAFCIDMHTIDARALGETEQRIYALNAWRETPFFTERERAALELAESVTKISDTHVPDEVFAKAREQFSDQELVNLVYAIVTINAWNRLAITFRAVPGQYHPKPKQEAAAS